MTDRRYKQLERGKHKHWPQTDCTLEAEVKTSTTERCIYIRLFQSSSIFLSSSFLCYCLSIHRLLITSWQREGSSQGFTHSQKHRSEQSYTSGMSPLKHRPLAEAQEETDVHREKGTEKEKGGRKNEGEEEGKLKIDSSQWEFSLFFWLFRILMKRKLKWR